MRRLLIPILVAICCLCAAVSAHAGGFAGVNYGLTFFNTDDASITTFAAPGTAPIFTPASVPGLRIGARSANGNEFHFDAGVMMLSTEGTTYTTLQLLISYQREFAPQSDVSPYANFGGGLFHTSFFDEGSTNPQFGAGFGVRKRVAEGWGDIRFEARVDHYFEDSSGFQAANAISLQLGFDLMFTKP